MIGDRFAIELDGSLGFSKANEFRRDDSTLMHELIEAMLSIRARLTKDDRTSIDTFRVSDSVDRHPFAIAFHVDLLDVSREPVERLTVREDCSRLVTADIRIVEAK